MCVLFKTEILQLEEDTVYYKVVTLKNPNEEKQFQSCVKSKARTVQNGYRLKGRVLNYKIGKNTTSSFEDTPGLYCFTTKEAASLFIYVRDAPFVIEKVIRVLVKKGTKIRFATSPFAYCTYKSLTDNKEVLNGKEVVLVESLTPLGLA